MEIDELISQLTLEEKAGLCSGLDYWHTKPVERLGIPSVMMCDGPHGLRKQVGQADHLGLNTSIETVCYPTASALAASFDRSVLERLGEWLGQECQAEEIAMLLGPGLNIKRSPLCGRNFEYFSEDPYLAGELGAAYIKALQAKGVSACVKHFACNNQETRRMSGSSQVDERTLHEIYLPAFEAAVKKGHARSVMCAYNAINQSFCSENKALLTDLLREKWGFDGMVVSDWGAVKDRVQGMEAGLDLEMPGGAGTQDKRIIAAVREGRLEESTLDKAVKNVLKFVLDSQSLQTENAKIDRKAAAEVSVELSAECAVLLKNEGVLPLEPESTVAFIGEFAAKPRYQGAGSSHINVPHPLSALECAAGRNVIYAKGYDVHSTETDEALLLEAVANAKQAQTAVVFAGLPDAFEIEGIDRSDLNIPANQNALIEAVAEANPNTVVVLHGGSCMALPWLAKVKAVLLMHLGGSGVGRATVELLYGEKNPSGKLAESWPLRLEDNPSYLNFPGEGGNVEYREGIFVGYRYYDKKKMDVQFPFGYGLSYTQFAYSGLTLDKTFMKDTDALTVTLNMKNTGSRAGAEAVQLYVRDIASTAARPVRELRGFEKVVLAPGETKTVTFRLDKRAFAYYEPKLHDWYVESGSFAVEAGSSSRDIRASAEVEVIGTVELPVTYTRNSVLGDIMKTEKGRAMFQGMMKKDDAAGNDAQKTTASMGEGSERLVQQMMTEMPLSGLVSLAGLSWEQVDGIVAMLNS